MSDPLPQAAAQLAERVAGLVTGWAQREGILARTTPDQFADIAKAFMAGYIAGSEDGPTGLQLEEPLVTRTGRVLSEADLAGLVAEAERGYDVEQIRERPE